MSLSQGTSMSLPALEAVQRSKVNTLAKTKRNSHRIVGFSYNSLLIKQTQTSKNINESEIVKIYLTKYHKTLEGTIYLVEYSYKCIRYSQLTPVMNT